MSAPHLEAGQNAEANACRFLEQQGMVKITQNYRCKLGEIDLIMRHQDTLVFVEVRLRSHQQFAQAAETVTRSKQMKIVRTAQYYLQQQNLVDRVNCRFDVVAFDQVNRPEWIQNAFEV